MKRWLAVVTLCWCVGWAIALLLQGIGNARYRARVSDATCRALIRGEDVPAAAYTAEVRECIEKYNSRVRAVR